MIEPKLLRRITAYACARTRSRVDEGVDVASVVLEPVEPRARVAEQCKYYHTKTRRSPFFRRLFVIGQRSSFKVQLLVVVPRLAIGIDGKCVMSGMGI